MRLHAPETAASAPLPAQAAEDTRARGRGWRPLLWVAGLLLLAALLVFTPPLVNANRYRTQIAQSMSRSLGRPVHLDNVSMHLLPVPGLTLQNLVVSEDPDFGAEPTIRANSVEATLRVSSLWRHPVEFSTVRFAEPSVNLVRDDRGRWNLSEILLHASRVDSAPTTQGHPGQAPRFPYIEATGGRLNVKLGNEKLPFSLTDADFALWLPTARQWRVRLVGHPARTDRNLTDPGTMRVEGELQRASSAAAVPVNLRASWHDAPLGEATRILAGTDWGWRGTLNVDATLAGPLGDARMASKVTLGGLRRAEFFPAHPLDLQVQCGSAFSLHPATLTGLHCTLPDNAPQPLALEAETVHLQGMQATTATLKGEAIPARWALLWAALFSPRVATGLQPPGTLDVEITRAPATDPGEAAKAWQGEVRLQLPAAAATGEQATANELVWQVNPGEGSWPSLALPPTPVTLAPGTALTLSGNLAASGYSFGVTGTATPAALIAPGKYLPQLRDGLAEVLPTSPDISEPEAVQFDCTRSWTAPQTCTPEKLSPVEARPRRASSKLRSR